MSPPQMYYMQAALSVAAGMQAAPDLGSLLRRARVLGGTFPRDSSFAFDSAYVKGGERRGWANWLVEGRLMLGQYPGCQPAVPGPSTTDAQAHLRRVLEAGVDCF
eukprot:3765075-Prymnesium_polylepis.1